MRSGETLALNFAALVLRKLFWKKKNGKNTNEQRDCKKVRTFS